MLVKFTPAQRQLIATMLKYVDKKPLVQPTVDVSTQDVEAFAAKLSAFLQK